MQHPIVRGLIAVAAFVVMAELLIIFTMPASWAQISIPITDHIAINLGELPQWITAGVAAGGLWKAWKAEKRAIEAALAAAAAVAHIEVVRKQTDGLVETVRTMAKKEGVQQERTEAAAAKEVLRVDAVADAEAAAKIRVAEERK